MDQGSRIPLPIAVTEREASPLRTYLTATLCATMAAAVSLLAWTIVPHQDARAAGPGAAATRTAPLNRMIEWDAARDGSPKTWQTDGVTVSLSERPGQDAPIPVLRLRGPGGETLSFDGQAGLANAGAHFGVGRLDPRVAGQQVIFSTYSGGAHCCSQVDLFELAGGRWRRVDMHQWGGEPISTFPTDIDGDGVRDVVMNDDRFDYAFASHAESLAPPRIYNVTDGAFTDVSTAPRYRRTFQRALAEAQSQCAHHNNGGCAAFVGIAARLGRQAWAWPIMLANYDRHSDWTYPTDCRVTRDADNNCPTAQTVTFRGMPQSLSWFLQANGYTRTPIAPLR